MEPVQNRRPSPLPPLTSYSCYSPGCALISCAPSPPLPAPNPAIVEGRGRTGPVQIGTLPGYVHFCTFLYITMEDFTHA